MNYGSVIKTSRKNIINSTYFLPLFIYLLVFIDHVWPRRDELMRMKTILLFFLSSNIFFFISQSEKNPKAGFRCINLQKNGLILSCAKHIFPFIFRQYFIFKSFDVRRMFFKCCNYAWCLVISKVGLFNPSKLLFCFGRHPFDKPCSSKCHMERKNFFPAFISENFKENIIKYII
jgi:hypothetical protein